MSFSYSGDPSSSEIDTVRFYAQDTIKDDAFLSDEEIQFLIDTWTPITDSLIYIAATACEVISSKFAREINYSADGISISGADLQQKYNDLATSLRDLHKEANIGGGPDVGGILWSDGPDPTVKPLIWGTGMNDNVRAGNQEYGGEYPAPQIPEIDGSY